MAKKWQFWIAIGQKVLIHFTGASDRFRVTRSVLIPYRFYGNGSITVTADDAQH